MNSGLSISKTVRGNIPTIPRTMRGLSFESIKDRVLGKQYELSLVFIGNTLSRRLNRERRGKDTPTNILSFELSKESGEIFIDLALAKKQAKKFDRTYSNFIVFLFIHGLFHLKGMEHGSTMKEAEEQTRRKFGI